MWTLIRERTGQMDGWIQRGASSSREVNPSRKGAQKFIRRPLSPPSVFSVLLRPPAYSRAPISVRAALYTLHNDVYSVVPTGTIVPKVNI